MKFFIILCLNILILQCGHLHSYPLIEKLVVTEKTITVVPGKELQQFLNKNEHFIQYDDEGLDLTKFDESILIMPFIFDVLAAIFISNKEYFVDYFDTEMSKSIERFRSIFKMMYPHTQWEGKIYCKNEITHNFQFSKNRVLTLFSGGIDSTYALLTNLDKTQILFTQQGHIDSTGNQQWEETLFIAQRFSELFNCKLSTAYSRGAYITNRYLCSKLSPDIYDWGLQAIGDLRWMGKAIPLMIFHQTSKLIIPATSTWDFPATTMANGVIPSAFFFGDCLSASCSGFDCTRTEKTALIADYLTKTFPGEKWKLKVCFNPNGKNCNYCRKCLRTIHDFYATGFDPNLFGFEISRKEIPNRLNQCLKKIQSDNQAHRLMESYFFYGLLQFIESHKLAEKDLYWRWFYDLIINQDFMKSFLEKTKQADYFYYRKLQDDYDSMWPKNPLH